MLRPCRTFIAAMFIAFPFAALPAQEPDGEPAGTGPVASLHAGRQLQVVPHAPEARTPVGGPRLADARVGVEAQVPADAMDLQPQDSATERRGVRHMIVGGATIIVGGLVGDDAGTVISVAGAALLIYGVYLYLQGS